MLLLRSRPPRQALAWAAARLGGPVVSARALRGGMSSAVHLLTVRDRSGQRRQAVLRRYVRPETSAGEPGIADREAQALRAAEAVSVPTPSLLAVDPSGAGAGVPAVLMSRLPGRVDWWPSDMERWLRRLAALLPAIHAAPLPPAGVLRPFAPDPQPSYRPPGWARYPRVWEQAAEISHAPPPRLPAVLLHRDFHPGNVLWQRGTVSGVVDWQAACTGPAVADVAHCRVNLLGFGTDAAQQFTALWQRAAGDTTTRGPTSSPSSASSTTCATTRDPDRTRSRTCSPAPSPNSAGPAGDPVLAALRPRPLHRHAQLPGCQPPAPAASCMVAASPAESIP